MSSKISFVKRATCFIVMLTLILTSLSSTALASNFSKTVTSNATYTFYADYEEVKEYLGSPRKYVPSTQSYDDGIYRGTLNLATITGHPTYVEENLLEVKIYVTYTGTVYAYATTKNVSHQTVYSFFVHYSQLSNYMYFPSYYIPQKYNYDDGTYKGILNLSYCYSYSSSASGDYYWVSIYAGYSGTAQMY